MGNHPELAIDLDAIVSSRPGGKKIPRFLVNWIKKLVHQDFINEFLTRGYEGAEFCRECMKYLDVDVKVEGLDNLSKVPEGCHYTLASNHPLGGIDGVALLSVITEHSGGRVRLLANDFLMSLKGLAPLCVPVNKLGGQTRSLPAQISEIFHSPNEIMMFPAGMCSRRIDGRVQDPAWKKTFVTYSKRSGRYIIPVHFHGENSKRFYRVASLCKKLGVKFNFAMLLLPDEMYRAQHKSFRMVIGEPIAPEHFDSSKSDLEWAQWLRSKSYSLL